MTQATSSYKDGPAISVKGLEKGFGKFQIHKGLDLDIPRGKVTYIMGGSGCGKSLLLKQVMGFIRPDKGTIQVNGQIMDHKDQKNLHEIRKNMGILFQHGALFDSLNVYNNVCFSLKEHLNLSKKELDENVENLLESVGLSMEHSLKMPSELSGGQRKRVALARAIALKPSIMMYDEPTTGLDPITTMMVTNLIKDVSSRHNLTSIVISHDTHVVFTVAEQIAFIKDGVVRYAGPPKGVFKSHDPDVREFYSLEERYNTED
ncbi:MAG: ATP-binding cassette domain-containing protein [Oligoflexia bacterium]|nr:ATP-binding cassette domain-containing protein [Oligoflexia bacterium]